MKIISTQGLQSYLLVLAPGRAKRFRGDCLCQPFTLAFPPKCFSIKLQFCCKSPSKHKSSNRSPVPIGAVPECTIIKLAILGSYFQLERKMGKNVLVPCRYQPVPDWYGTEICDKALILNFVIWYRTVNSYYSYNT